MIPLVLLAIPAVVSGFANPPAFLSFLGIPTHWFADFMKTPVIAEVLGEHSVVEFNFGMAGLSTLVAGLGVFLAYIMYGAKWLSAESVGRVFGPLYTVVFRKYWFDELYQAVLDRVLFGVSRVLYWFDIHIVDGTVNGVARLAAGAGSVIRRWETGHVQGYATAIFVGVLLIVGVYLVVA